MRTTAAAVLAAYDALARAQRAREKARVEIEDWSYNIIGQRQVTVMNISTWRRLWRTGHA